MKKVLKLFVFAVFVFLPFRVFAASNYTVEMVSNQIGNKVVGTYNNYNAALNAMNSQKSDANSVATIYRDGVPVDSKYGIFKFKPGKTYNLYTSATGSAYTYIHGSYGTDAALLGYSDNGRVKIMISGYTGWTEINNGVVTPISLMGINGNVINVKGGLGIRIRKKPSTSATIITQVKTTSNFTYTETTKANGYTWYKITYNGSEAWIAGTDDVTVLTGSNGLGTYYNHYGPTGNLIHHFTYYNGSGYGDTFTNLGTSPSFLTKDVRYYSFDGNYFYSSITSMLDDYREGKYSRSVNYNSPYYSYYVYLPSHSVTGYSAEDLDRIIANKGYNANTSKMFGTGKYFKEAEETYGQNALMMFSTAMNESASGTSKIAKDKNNLFGYGAADSCAYDCAYSYGSVRDSIMDYAKRTGDSYAVVTGKYYYGGHYGNKASGRNVKYASDPYWGEKQAGNSFLSDLDYGGKDFNSSTIGVTNKDFANVWVFDKPERSDAAHRYSLKNPNTSASVYNVSVNVVDKVLGANNEWFYKVYTDLPAEDNLKFGYVLANEVNVSNNQPVINASDKTIKEGDTFNPLDDVTASDKENGNLTNKITYESNVNPNKEGTYKVTYTVVDNSNFHASKTITVKVISAENPIITASDREVKQFEEFDYMDGVSAKAYDGTDLTDDITYKGTVNTDIADTYEVTYKVKDSKGKEASKTVKITVIPNAKPVINVSDKEVYLNSEFDPLEGVTASDEEDGEITDIEYKGTVNTKEVGDYKVTYMVTDKNGQTTEKTITVKVIVNQLPVINAYDKTITINTKFDPLEGITAYDNEDGTITDIRVLKNDVKIDTLGKYEVTYEVTDSYDQTVTKTIMVTVSEKVLVEKEGEFYLDYLKEVDGNLQIKGYNIIKNVNNDLNTNIEYELILVNQNNNKEYSQKLERITDKNQMTIPILSEDGYDYTYSWFVGNINFNSIPEGNYTVYLKSTNSDYYSKSLVKNIFLNEQVSQYNTKGKYVTITNDYMSVDIPINFTVRDSELAKKETSADTNQFSYIEKVELNDKYLHLKGASYSVDMNMNKDAKVSRKIIFENQDNFDKYTFDLGYINNGTFMIELVAPDKFGISKPLAWYDSNIDISNLPKGKYVIYITNESNIADYGELSDVLLFTSFDKANGSINGKKYRLYLNDKLRYRVELTIE